jgi:hypothetical protein
VRVGEAKMDVQLKVAVWDARGCITERREFHGRRQAFRFADAQLARGREVRLDTLPPAGSPPPSAPPPLSFDDVPDTAA